MTSANHTALELLGCLTVLNDDCGELFVNDQQKGLDALYLLLKRGMRETNKLALWLLSNLSAGSQVQISAIYKHAIMPEVVELAENVGTLDVRREAFLVLYNLVTINVNHEQIKDTLLMDDCRLLNVLIESAQLDDKKLTLEFVDFADNVLRLGLIEEFDKNGGIKML